MRRFAFVLAAALLTPTAAQAVVHNLIANINDAQETTCPAVVSASLGTVTATLDDVTNLFSYTVQFGQNAPLYNDGALNGTQTVGHFHGPAAPGATASPQVTIANGSPVSATNTLTAAQETQVLAGLWYVNIHSTLCPGGEIRGQLREPLLGPALPTWGWVLFGALALCGVALISHRVLRKA